MSTKAFLLGPDFETQTPAGFYSYVLSLKIEKPIKIGRVPKALRPVVLHQLDASKRCTICKKKPRSEKSVCKVPKSVVKNESA